LLLSPPATFDQLIINERKKGARWVYSFEGNRSPGQPTELKAAG
jgi:hypothetical protein